MWQKDLSCSWRVWNKILQNVDKLFILFQTWIIFDRLENIMKNVSQPAHAFLSQF